MASMENTPRYRNFSSNMPLALNGTPRAVSSLITVEKEPERDPEQDCFMCRQGHVYVKPVGMQQERRVARRHPPPLTRAQMDELSRKKHLTKQEARKLLQCYFPEIKNVKYFQLHKYHSCCYDPKHLNLCKNHITALQREREQYGDHHHHHDHDGNDEDHHNDFEKENGKPNRVSFVRIKIEPTKGIPTRFLGPTALPESLADMLIKQVNRLEDKKPTASFNSNYTVQPYQIRRINNEYAEDDGDDDEEEEEEEEEEDEPGKTGKREIVVEDLDELKRLRLTDQATLSRPLKRKKRKNGTKTTAAGQQQSKLKHWEKLAMEQAKNDQCNCRHAVMRKDGDQTVYDWCRCKDNQHKELMERRQSLSLVPSSPPEIPEEPTPTSSPPPPPPPREPPKAKPRKVRKKSIGIDATEQNTTELALAYDPSAVDYDMIQEVIYYRTSSGRLIKPEVTNAFTYDTMPPAITTMTLNPNEPAPRKAEVLYMAPNGQLQPYESGGRRLGNENNRSGQPRSIVLTNPGSLYNGEAYISTDSSQSKRGGSVTMPVLKLPQSLTTSREQSSSNRGNHRPTEFTLARFSSGKSTDTPVSRRSITSTSPQTVTSGSQRASRLPPKSMQKSSKPTYANFEPTPDYGRESSVLANRRWFDQPLGDQNLRPVHDGQYGLIAGTSTGQYNTKSQPLPNINEIDPNDPQKPQNTAKCTIS